MLLRTYDIREKNCRNCSHTMLCSWQTLWSVFSVQIPKAWIITDNRGKIKNLITFLVFLGPQQGPCEPYCVICWDALLLRTVNSRFLFSTANIYLTKVAGNFIKSHELKLDRKKKFHRQWQYNAVFLGCFTLNKFKCMFYTIYQKYKKWINKLDLLCCSLHV